MFHGVLVGIGEKAHAWAAPCPVGGCGNSTGLVDAGCRSVLDQMIEQANQGPLRGLDLRRLEVGERRLGSGREWRRC
ncbi:hypothetical protein DKT68_02900 [Micromonospora acroterricola]|uniref:Uncharacterized protein n=1 Tax=Micromonospora acroterricola TaxID=2202421 RepID=A0A317DE82_9ACTN|nr:hypothetical protein DKT68_02900 [Micromonospora acroterricola]